MDLFEYMSEAAREKRRQAKAAREQAEAEDAPKVRLPSSFQVHAKQT